MGSVGTYDVRRPGMAVRDMVGDFEKHCPGAQQNWLLVRPDRYVMACIPRHNGQTTVDALNALLNNAV